MDLLDEANIDLWIEILVQAKSVGFSLPSSPVELLLELMVDIATKLRNQLREGTSFWEGRKNPSLKFSEQHVDSLSNPKVLRITEERKVAWDPTISLFFEKLANSLIQLKRTHKLSEDLYSTDKPETANRKIQQKSYQFFQRRSRRKKRSNHKSL